MSATLTGMTHPPHDPTRPPLQPHQPQQVPPQWPPARAGQYPPPAVTAARKPRSITTGGWLAIGGGAVGAILVVVCAVGALASIGSGLPDQSHNNNHPYDPPVPTDTAPVSIPSLSPAATQAAAPPPSPTISEGTWSVGVDFPAGTYRAVGAGSSCYWKITKSGSNDADIVNNHLGGGNLTVTLSAGQDFTTEQCGTWTKVG